LLLSMPGSPCLYYGDEIGMGDNIWLSDRDAVRTPMQWTPDRNAGFSTADPGKLYLPVVQSLVNHYGSINVEAQLASKSSLLHWTREMLALRRRHPVFGLGRYVPVESDNPRLLAFLRVLAAEDAGVESPETVLCVNNLAQTPQATTLRLDQLAGRALTDLFGGGGFPAIDDDGTLTLSLGSRDFFWLRVDPDGAV
jgi:maltose alpha-D-glucosyltransferase/alpha-amylase